MQDGLIRVSAVSSPIRVADVSFNRQEIEKRILAADEAGAKLCLFPELALTGVSAMDLFRQRALLEEAKTALFALIKDTASLDILGAVGLPILLSGKIYDVLALFTKGELLGLVPKTLFSDDGLMQSRVFTPGPKSVSEITVTTPDGETVTTLFGRNLLFTCGNREDVRIAVVFTEELSDPESEGYASARTNANILLCPGNAPEIAGGRLARRALLETGSEMGAVAILYAGPSQGESTEDNVWSAHSLIVENGRTLKESTAFSTAPVTVEIDTELLAAEAGKRARTGAPEFAPETAPELLKKCTFLWKKRDFPPARRYSAYPFRPDDPAKQKAYFEEILALQAMGLRKRLEHTGCNRVLIGVSGGLDSTWALLVAARACDYLGLDRSRITAVTMPCFGTSERTYKNALTLSDSIGAELLEINIKNAVRTHFEDIGQDENKKDVAYENSQARERTQVLMDLANRLNGLVVGTGDLSELALGWATYNGDHMSNYGVNGSIPKTLMRDLVRNYGEETENEALRGVLLDILETPVSPELLPAEEGKIAQKTEDLVGPYELHDFFLYYMVKYGFRPSKIFRMAKRTWGAEYSDETILKWLRTFCRRFLTQQFKRSCMPDGPQVTEISLSPRGAMLLPSDAASAMWLQDLEEITL